VVEEAQGEAHISAEQPSPGQAPRVPSSHADPGRPGDRPFSPAEGPRPAVGLTSTAATWRVRDRATFEALRREGRRSRRGVVAVTYLPPASSGGLTAAGPPRFAYGVGKRVGPAVVRNRVRRRLRAAARELARGEPGLVAGAYLVTASPRAVDVTYAELRRSLAEACAAASSPASASASLGSSGAAP